MQAFSTLPHPPPITRQHWPWHLLRCTKFLLWVYALFSSVLSHLFNFLLLEKKKSLLQPTKLIAQASNRSRWAFCKTLLWNPISETLYSLKRNDTRCCLWPAWSGMTRCWAHLFSTCSYLTLRLNLFDQDLTDLWILLVEVWEKETNFFCHIHPTVFTRSFTLWTVWSSHLSFMPLHRILKTTKDWLDDKFQQDHFEGSIDEWF